MWHRNSQKRIYGKNLTYFVTFYPKNRISFFENEFLCELLKVIIECCEKTKNAELLGYKINPDHVHVLIKPGNEYNISECIHSIKRISSFQINQHFKSQSINKKFIWQKSYHDHVIRDEQDLTNHFQYLEKQWIKHKLKENKYLFRKRGYKSALSNIHNL